MSVLVTCYSKSSLPTPHGEMMIYVYREERGHEHVAVVSGQPRNPVLCRVHSECLTGEVFGSLRCDCRSQLDLAFERIGRAGAGAIIYLRQEGRGIGLGNKIRAYELQDSGVDTVAANEQLGFAADERSYGVAAAILMDLGIYAVKLMTNNPAKIDGLVQGGVEVVERIQHWTKASPHNNDYLDTKRVRMGHV